MSQQQWQQEEEGQQEQQEQEEEGPEKGQGASKCLKSRTETNVVAGETLRSFANGGKMRGGRTVGWAWGESCDGVRLGSQVLLGLLRFAAAAAAAARININKSLGAINQSVCIACHAPAPTAASHSSHPALPPSSCVFWPSLCALSSFSLFALCLRAYFVDLSMSRLLSN